MNVLVAGGTGFVGTELCRALADRGHDVTVMARHPDAASLPDAVETVTGDVTDRESVATAVAGRDAVVNLVALSPLFEPDGGSEAHDWIHRGGTANLVAVAEDTGVDRFVQMSALGADPDGSTAYLRAKGAAEEVVRASDLDWTLVRPSVVFGDGGEFVGFTKLLTTPYVTGLPGGGATRFQPIWVGDLAPMLAECATEDRHVGRTYELGGPEVLTLADVTRAAYRAEGKSTVVLPVPTALARVGLTLAGFVPVVPFGPDQYRSLRLDNTVADNDVTAFGREPSSLRTLGAYLDGRDERDGDADRHDGVDRHDGDGVDRGGGPRGVDDGDRSDRDAATTPLYRSRAVLTVFGFLAGAWSLQYVVDIYVNPLVRWLFVVPYVVTLFLFDNGVAERVVYAVEPFVPVPGPVLWEVGNLLTYYCVALGVGALARAWGECF